MKHILIIGCGRIGFRHFESLLQIKKKIKITVIDNSNISLNKIKNKVKSSLKKNISINYSQKINKFFGKIDLAIISTNADVRKKIIFNLLKKNSVRNIILEKIAFQNMKDFFKVENSLRKKKINCYVNFPRREMLDYIKLKKFLSKENRINITVNGTNWGLASNAIHMLDLLSFLKNSKQIKLFSNNLEKKIYKANRQKFKEFKGSLVFINENKDTIFLNDNFYERKKNRGGIMIESDNFSLKIFESKNLISIINFKDNLKTTVKKFNTKFQSSLTSLYVEKILKNGKINLPTLKESENNHKIILDTFLSHLKKLKKKTTHCPIT
jgi:predicted dehydrogenase